MKISLSLNKNIIDKSKNSIMGIMSGYYKLSVADFVKNIKSGFAWSAGKFENNKRKKEFFQQSEVIGIDIDNTELRKVPGQKKLIKVKVSEDKYFSLQKVFKDEFTQKNALLIYTSPSHTDSHHRFRIIFKLSKMFRDYKQIESIAKQLIAYYKSDKSCSDCTRLFYGNTKAKVKVFGNTYDMEVANCDHKKPKEKYKVSHTIERLLSTKKDLQNMLIAIKNKHDILEYDTWLKLCSSIWSVFTYGESIELLQVYYPEEKTESYKYKYEHRLETIPYMHIIKEAIKCGYKPVIDQYPDFVRTNTDGEMIIPTVSVIDYLTRKGYFTFFPNSQEPNQYQVIREEENIITETGLKLTSEYLQNHIIKNYASIDAEQLRTKLLGVSMPKVFTFLHSPDIELHTDMYNKGYFYYNNGFLEITKNDMIFHESYKNLGNTKIWKSSINAHVFKHDDKEGDFEQFFHKISNEDTQRFEILCAIFGYLLHRYKDANVNKCVVLNDEKIDIDNPSGRTGKSLIAKAIGHVRNVLIEPAKDFNTSERFCWQNVELSTNVICLDDIPPKFSLKKLYSILTGNLKVEKKGEKSYMIPFNRSPKFLITSNYTVDTGGGSDRARVVELALHNHYNEYFQPKHEFGHLFFDEWDNTQWNRFYTFCAKCMQMYFNNGLLHTISERIIRNKLMKQTNENFVLWTEDFNFRDSKKTFFPSKGLYQSYMNFVKDDPDCMPVSSDIFGKFMRIFFNENEIPFKKKNFRTKNGIVWGYNLVR